MKQQEAVPPRPTQLGFFVSIALLIFRVDAREDKLPQLKLHRTRYHLIHTYKRKIKEKKKKKKKAVLHYKKK